MRTSVISIPLLAAIANAAPQFGLGGGGGGGATTSNDIQNGNCGDVTLVMARGSTEQGNMGAVVGAPLCDAMQQMGNVACQGVGGAYKATLQANFQPQGTDQASIDEATSTIMNAFQACPNSAMTIAGYSQGSAVMLGAIQALPQAMQDQIAGVAFYGYTQNQQTGGSIPNFPQNKLQINCANGDNVCNGNLAVSAAHLSYTNDGSVPAGAQFLMSMAGATN